MARDPVRGFVNRIGGWYLCPWTTIAVATDGEEVLRRKMGMNEEIILKRKYERKKKEISKQNKTKSIKIK